MPVKICENRSIFGEDMDKSLWLTFWGHPVLTYTLLATCLFVSYSHASILSKQLIFLSKSCMIQVSSLQIIRLQTSDEIALKRARNTRGLRKILDFLTNISLYLKMLHQDIQNGNTVESYAVR